MKTTIIKQLSLLFLLLFFIGCATIPPEFLVAMQKEKEGIQLLKKRHQQTVLELTENWYNERRNRLLYIKQLEINKITLSVNNPNGKGNITVLKKDALAIIEKQFSEGLNMAAKIKQQLLQGYADTENWRKLVKLNAINLEMTQSLTDLNASQRAFYLELVGQNVPFPSDFINQQTQELLTK
ncbi:hypothetical protein [uncultured Tenacibaculum sp.]|uniref:hypothetical protein n=1 Tax=uncultured Tenacibaculum sp. TaxID=174713 RepID=UPI002613929B|nr:hypothetical protein [uncultured Tenacibaculum sp.]